MIWISKVAKFYRRFYGGGTNLLLSRNFRDVVWWGHKLALFTGVDRFPLSALHQKLKKTVEVSFIWSQIIVILRVFMVQSHLLLQSLYSFLYIQACCILFEIVILVSYMYCTLYSPFVYQEIVILLVRILVH